jgi:putative ubiquitin-RnfH superfamily antitoxin RatB of RatAB toxin-antitoxin module
MVPAEPVSDAAALWVVEVAWSPGPGEVRRGRVRLRPGATVADALAACADQGWPEGWQGVAVGVWGKCRPADHPLQDGDRVECYRALRVDPKEARRQRYRAQGERGRAPRRPVSGNPGP